MDRLEILREMSFGKRVAEQEQNELQKYFVETHLWTRVLKGEIDVVYGAKGAGKSAIYSLMYAQRKKLFDQSTFLLAAENPRGKTVFANLIVDPPTSEIEFINLWKLYFLTLIGALFKSLDLVVPSEINEIVKYLEEANLIPANHGRSRILKRVIDYVRRFLRPDSAEGGIKFDPMTGVPVGVTGKITFSEPSFEAEKNGVVSVDNLLEQTDSALGKLGFKFWLLLDRLDVAFQDSQELEENGLRALFRVYLSMLNLDCICPKIFLRNDIWARISKQGFREASHISNAENINWNKNLLLNLIIKRILANEKVAKFYEINDENALSIAQQEELFYQLFPNQIDPGEKKRRTFDWILSRIKDGTGTIAPRELIHLFNEARKIEIKKIEIGEDAPVDGRLISRKSFKEALKAISDNRIYSTIYAEYPELKADIEKLKKKKCHHNASTLSKIWSIEEIEALEVANELVRIGFFEQRGGHETPEFWVPFLYRPGLDMIQGKAF